MNKIELLGRLTKDPVVKYTQGEKPLAIAEFTLAVPRKMKKDQADFIICKGFGTTATFIEKYLKKGMQIATCGSLNISSYENKEGKKITSYAVIVEDVEMCGSKATNGGKSSQEQEQQTQDYDFMNIPDGLDGDLPFM